MYLIQAEGLRKVYRIRQRDGNWLKSMFSSRRMTVEALRSVSFSIREGELIGYIGPNGAGKSTTVKLLSGILTPDGGTCSVLGLTPWSQRRQLAGKIGVVFGQRSQLWWDLPVDDSFRLLRDIYRVKEPDFRRVRDELCDRLSLGALLQTPVRQLSLGQRMRCELAGALALSCSITLLMQATLFWTVAGDGVARILPSIIFLLSGMVIPLPLFPDWAQPFLRIQPFYGLSGAVSMLFCQILPAREAGQVIALQWGWTAAFVLGGRWLMGRGLRRLNVAGG